MNIIKHREKNYLLRIPSPVQTYLKNKEKMKSFQMHKDLKKNSTSIIPL